MLILLVNDDGIHAPGIRAMHEALSSIGDVRVVAPMVEQSGVSHQITYRRPIVVHKVIEDGMDLGWMVDGSPADCTKLGVMEFCERQPDLIVSGINSGANVGVNTLYSGTVAAATEGALFGIPSFAVSQFLRNRIAVDYHATARRAVPLIERIRSLAPKQRLWGINFPAVEGEPAGVKFVRMQVRRDKELVERREDPRGRPYFWTGIDPIKNHHHDEDTDVAALQEGYVTVTPLITDLTDYARLGEWHDRELSWE